MRILHISSAKTWRGGEQQIAYLVGELNSLGGQVESIVFAPGNSPLSQLAEKNGWPCIQFHKHLLKFPAIQKRIKKICEEQKVDLIHAHDAHAHSLAVMSAAVWRNHVPIVLSRRVTFGIRDNAFSRWKYNHTSIRKILCVSEQILKSLKKDISQPDKLSVVYSGVDPDRFTENPGQILRNEFKIPKDLPIIANTAAIAPDKDHMTFVRTAKSFFDKGGKAVFLIIGKDQGEKAKVKALIEEFQLTDKIIFTGFRTDIEEVLPEVDVFFFSSAEEGLGTSLLDAFAAKVPIVSTDAGGIPELITHEKTGLMGPTQQPDVLADLLLRMISDTDLQKQVAEGATDRLQDFNKSATAMKTYECYQNILNQE